MDYQPTNPSTGSHAIAAQPAGRFARLMEAWFGRTTDRVPAGEPFRDSDFDLEPDSGFFGRALGEH